MFGLGSKDTDDDNLPVFVRALQSNEAFDVAHRLWNENSRLLYIDQTNHKEFLRFTYARPPCNVWLQRDQGRTDLFELILAWKDDKHTVEVFIVTRQPGDKPIGDAERLKSVLNAMLTTPSIVPANSKS